MDFSDAIIVGIPLVLVVLGLVEWVKQLGVQGNAVRYVSMAIGLIFGLATSSVWACRLIMQAGSVQPFMGWRSDL